MDEYEFKTTKMERIAWYISAIIVFAGLLTGLVMVIISAIDGTLFLSQAIPFGIIIIGVIISVIPVFKNTIRVFKKEVKEEN